MDEEQFEKIMEAFEALKSDLDHNTASISVLHKRLKRIEDAVVGKDNQKVAGGPAYTIPAAVQHLAAGEERAH
jgi:hypothetical protein